MDSMACNNVQPVVRKVKKKQAKGELDRLKQAEKKKRRLEKALATSAAIRSELEKKKQQKKEEQQRLDEEGAAVAEAVALHVLLGEDSDDIILKKEEAYDRLDPTGNMYSLWNEQRAYAPYQEFPRPSPDRIRLVSNACGSGCKWRGADNNAWSDSYGSLCKAPHLPYFDVGGWENAEFSAGMIAAQAVSSLQITEDACVDTIMFNGMLHG